MYGNVKQYLGPAHGFAGNVHALRGYVDDDVLRGRVTGLLERTARHDDGLVNWPPSMNEMDAQIRVQWCHGAPGIISTLGDLILGWKSVAGATPFGPVTWGQRCISRRASTRGPLSQPSTVSSRPQAGGLEPRIV